MSTPAETFAKVVPMVSTTLPVWSTRPTMADIQAMSLAQLNKLAWRFRNHLSDGFQELTVTTQQQRLHKLASENWTIPCRSTCRNCGHCILMMDQGRLPGDGLKVCVRCRPHYLREQPLDLPPVQDCYPCTKWLDAQNTA